MITPSRRWTDRGTLITFFVVAMALLDPLFDTKFSASMLFGAGGLGLLFVFLTTRLDDRLKQEGALSRRVLYLLVQFLVLAAISWIFIKNRLFSTVWLLHMPFVAQARMLLPLSAAVFTGVCSLALLMMHLYALAGWQEVPSSLVALSTAVVFVLVFSDFAMRESTARDESQRLSEQLEQANRQLGEYAVQAEELAIERERARMAREIHDSVGHSLTALHMQLQAAEAVLDLDAERAREALAKARRCAQDGLNEIRSSVSALRADPLDGRNLHGALADLAEMSSSSGLPVRFTVRGQQRPLDQATTLTLFRSAQEGLTNAKKHAEARQVDLEIDYGATSRDGVRLTVQDDGVGSERLLGTPRAGSFGLIGLRERARQQGGQLELTSAPGEGVRLALSLPTELPVLFDETGDEPGDESAEPAT